MVREAYHCTWDGQAVCLPDDTVPQITLPAVSLALGSHWPVKPHLGSRAILGLDRNGTVLHHKKKRKKNLISKPYIHTIVRNCNFQGECFIFFTAHIFSQRISSCPVQSYWYWSVLMFKSFARPGHFNHFLPRFLFPLLALSLLLRNRIWSSSMLPNKENHDGAA